MHNVTSSAFEVKYSPRALSTAPRCDDRFSFAAVGSAVRCGNRCGKVSGRWEHFAVVQFEDGAIERVSLNRVFELESGT